MIRYVALGSSMAAGPGIRPRAAGAPFPAGRSARNYPHVVAEELGLDLVDVTYSGATTANVLTESQYGAPPQIDALDGSEELVTVTIGRRIAERLAQATADAAADTGCGLVHVAEASRDHHAWSAVPWTTKFGLPLPGRPMPLHPNADGMRAVADLVVARAS